MRFAIESLSHGEAERSGVFPEIDTGRPRAGEGAGCASGSCELISESNEERICGLSGTVTESNAPDTTKRYARRMIGSDLESRLRRRPFYVLGEVVHPGTYPYEPDTSVLAAVLAAGGFTHRAHRSWAHVLHAGAKEEVAVPIEPDFLVSPGDIIRIDGRAS